MLEYLRRDEGRNAGLTNSPDFFLRRGGLECGWSSSSSPLSSVPDVAVDDSVMPGEVTTMADSVLDLEWDIFLASGVNVLGDTT